MNYEVERIIDKRVTLQRVEYYVKWKGYDQNENSWQPEKSFKKCKEMLDTFNSKYKTPKKSKEGEHGTKRKAPGKNTSFSQRNRAPARTNKRIFGEEKSSFISQKQSQKKERNQFSRSRNKLVNSRDFQKRSADEQGRSFKKLSFSVDIMEIQDPILDVKSMSKDSEGEYWYSVMGPNGRETVPRSVLIKRNFMALIVFYEKHFNFREETK